MKCRFILASLISSLLSVNSYGLAIGNAKTVSRYGEPIALEIELYGMTGLDKKAVSYKIGSVYGDGKKIDYKNAKFGLYSSGNIGWLTISIPEKSLFRKIKYDIEVTWPGGKMARSYSGQFLGVIPSDSTPQCHSKGTLFRCSQ